MQEHHNATRPRLAIASPHLCEIDPVYHVDMAVDILRTVYLALGARDFDEHYEIAAIAHTVFRVIELLEATGKHLELGPKR